MELKNLKDGAAYFPILQQGMQYISWHFLKIS